MNRIDHGIDKPQYPNESSNVEIVCIWVVRVFPSDLGTLVGKYGFPFGLLDFWSYGMTSFASFDQVELLLQLRHFGEIGKIGLENIGYHGL